MEGNHGVRKRYDESYRLKVIDRKNKNELMPIVLMQRLLLIVLNPKMAQVAAVRWYGLQKEGR